MKEISIPISAGTIAAKVYEAESDVIVFTITGTGSSIEMFEPISMGLSQAADVNVMTMQYSGQDAQNDVYSFKPAWHFLEVIETFDKLVKTYQDKKIVVFGTSYGGMLAAQLAKYRDFHKLILAAPAIYPPDAFYTTRSDQDTDEIMHLRKDIRMLDEHPLLTREKAFSGKALVAVHDRDEVIPSATTEAYIRHLEADELHFDLPHSAEDSSQTDETIKAYCSKLAEWISL